MHFSTYRGYLFLIFSLLFIKRNKNTSKKKETLKSFTPINRQPKNLFYLKIFINKFQNLKIQLFYLKKSSAILSSKSMISFSIQHVKVTIA
jgi:hypothetical protein